MNLKSVLLSWKDKNLRTENIIRKHIPFAEARTIGILFHADEESHINIVSKLVNQLEHDHKKVKVLGYATQPISVSNKLIMSEFTKKDITGSGQIKNEKVNEFIHAEFDYLFCLHTENFPPFNYILQRSHARCRVGRFEAEHTPLYEFMIDTPPGTLLVSLLNQILHYLKEIKH
jgi:hypothetical protein